MAAAKTQPTDTPLEELLAGVAAKRRRDDAQTVATMMQRVTGEQPVVWGTSLVGFGSYDTPSGPWPVVAFAARKQATVLYLGECPEREALLDRLGRHTTGAGCIYLPDVPSVDSAVLEQLIAASYAARAHSD